MHKFFHFAHLKPIFSILHNYFYEIPTSVCLFNTFFYLNNIFLTIFYYSQLPVTPPVTLTHTPKYIWSLSRSISFSLSSFFFFSFSFFLFLNFFFFSVFVFLLLLLKRENSSWISFFLHFLLILLQFQFDYLYGFDDFFF